MDGTKTWWQSKTVWGGLVAVRRADESVWCRNFPGPIRAL